MLPRPTCVQHGRLGEREALVNGKTTATPFGVTAAKWFRRRPTRGTDGGDHRLRVTMSSFLLLTIVAICFPIFFASTKK